MEKLQRIILLFLILINSIKSYSQKVEINLSPEGKLETIYDNQGNQLKLKDILINAPKNSGVLTTTNLNCSTTSYFNLYFEPGCGMEDTTNPTHNARRAVMCKVFEDISNFITSPLSTTGNKVNIWVRNIANMDVSSGTLGLASSYYLPYPNVGGILDGEIWKTIHLGVDSYKNVLNGTNLFYHGRVAFNFNDPNINWNTNLSINSPSNLYDLYTVILHEVVHSLGFNSFINENGASIDPSPYYSRYDTFLQTNNNIPLLTIGSCSMYDVSFNSAVSPTVLRPGCTLPNNISNGVLNNTVCNNAIKYVGSSTIPVYTPTCFEQGSSLSHFEDMLYPTCASPYGNDSYFVLSNVILLGVTKRYLKPEERNVLCDIGYNVKTTFGDSTTSNGFYNYGGTACNGIVVAGLNDGINSNGDYTFVGNANSNIVISGATILNNDVSATSFECLQDISAVSTLSATSGTSSTSINFSSATTGLHVLRYVPINGTKRGNITYIYVYIRVPAIINGCTPTSNSCNLVMNGDFEQFSDINASPIIRKACGWDSVFQLPPDYLGDSSAYAKYFSSTANSYPSWIVPCNWYGYQFSNNNIGNGYAGLSISTGVGGKQHIYTRLNNPLQANTNYQLSFDVSLADGYSHWASNLQAFLHRSNTTPPSILAYNSNGDVSIVNNASDSTTQLISPTVTRNTNGWDTITFNFTTTTGGEQFLYLGLLNNATLVTNTPAATGISGCSYQSAATNLFGNRLISYYIDNVSLIPTNGAVFNLPSSICNAQNLNNLSIYLSGTNTNGVFSGNGVTLVNGVYSFNASVAGVGTNTISYTFTNSSGCSITIYDSINVTTSTDTHADLFIKDSQDENGSEPNTITQYMWTSDNIWVRNYNDNELTHQNPDYSANGNPNYVKVRVINKSCITSTGSEQLKLYWAKASTSLGYPNPWFGGVNHPITNANMGDPIGTMSIPEIPAGGEAILTFEWFVPNPANYGNDGDQWHFCLLARIEATTDPMTFPETGDLNGNVRNNNNIAWKNVTVVDVLPNNIVNPGGLVAVGNPFNHPKTFFLELEVADLETGKPIYQEAEVGIKMDDVLFNAWERGGKEAQLLDPTVEEKRKIIKGNNVIVDNILFNANEIGTLRLDFNFLTKELTDKTNYAYHVIQKDAITGQVIGGETFIINKSPRPIFEAEAPDKDVDLNQAITISAEDINEPAIYNWYDDEGNLIFQGKELQIANAVAEKYKLEVISTVDGFKDYAEVEVTLKPSILENIAPNPTINNVLVNYKLNSVSSAYLMVIGHYGSNGASNNYILDINSTEINLNVSNYESGFYTVALVVDGVIVDAKTLIKI